MLLFLQQAGWERVEEVEDAELIIVNSCGFIESAKRESIEAVLSFKKAFPEKKIVLAGCLAQRYGKELVQELPEATTIVGNGNIAAIVEAATAAMADEHRAILPAQEFISCSGNRPLLSLPGSAYIKITEGCNNRCSYCAIPLIRGPLRSRPIPAIVQECTELLQRGIKELCLVGQDLGSYGFDIATTEQQRTCLLPQLLESLLQLPGEFWIRLLYIHPDRFPQQILELCARDSRIVPYFDLPFQHASTPILRKMYRKGTSEIYLDLIKKIRSRLPAAVIRSTFLVGFPGETEEDFEALLQFQQDALLEWLGVFTYSREEGTDAYSLGPRVSKKVAASRKERIETAQIPITEERLKRLISTQVQCLVEERIEGEPGLYLGRAYCHAPEVDGAAVLTANTDLEPGSFVQGVVTNLAGFDIEVLCSHDS